MWNSSSVPPDLNYFAIQGFVGDSPHMLIYKVSTGEFFAAIKTERDMPWFTPDGYTLWCSSTSHGGVEGWEIGKDSEPDFPRLKLMGKPLVQGPEGCPWKPPYGYQMTDGWVLGSHGKQLLWLPPQWRLPEVHRVWCGQFLALRGSDLPEVCILELLEE